MIALSRPILRVALIGCALALAGCESMSNGDRDNSTTMPSAAQTSANSNSSGYNNPNSPNNNSYIGNGAFGQTPP